MAAIRVLGLWPRTHLGLGLHLVFCPAFLVVDEVCSTRIVFCVCYIKIALQSTLCLLSTREFRTAIGEVACTTSVHSSLCMCIIMPSLITLIKALFIVHD